MRDVNIAVRISQEGARRGNLMIRCYHHVCEFTRSDIKGRDYSVTVSGPKSRTSC
jgi:hypothetical protein